MRPARFTNALCPACGHPGRRRYAHLPPERLDATAHGGPGGACRACYDALRRNHMRVHPEPAVVILARLARGETASGVRCAARVARVAALPFPGGDPFAAPAAVEARRLRAEAVRAEGLAAMTGRAVPKDGSTRYRFERAPEPETPTGRDLLRLVTRPLAGGGRVRFRGVTPPPLPAADPGLFDLKPPPKPVVRKPNPYRDRAGAVIARNRQRKALGIRDRP